MKTTIAIINRALEEHPNAGIAYSGGTDSGILIDIIYTRTKHRPPIFAGPYTHQWPATKAYAESVAKRYKAELIHTPDALTELELVEHWKKNGWPMLGKMIARKWNRQHKDRGFGFKCDCTGCCRRLVIAPKRKAMKAAGLDHQFTGLRGKTDSVARGMSAHKHGTSYHNKLDDMWITNPLTGWTDLMGRRYVKQNRLPRHPMKERGAETIGCICCGGGSQFTGSCYPHARRLDKSQWRKWIVTHRMGEIVLAIKYDEPLQRVRAALDAMGGIEKVARERPHVFDFSCHKPLAGYDKR